MVKADKCPICGVAVKPENLVRHLDSIHPRHEEAAALREKLKQEPGRAATKRAAPPLLKRWHIGVIAAIVVLAVGAYYVAPYLVPPQTFPIDGCINDATVIYHIHPSLSIIIQGNRYPIPNDIGITATCTHPLHTHEDYNPATQPATIHVESPVAQAFTLGQFFQVWGQPFSSSQVVTCTASPTTPIAMTVDGQPSNAFGSLVFQDLQVIVVTCG